MDNLEERIKHARLLREHYLRDHHRPGYHLMVPEGRHHPVDPNGALYWNGRFHLCYIYQHEGRHYWGHVSSRDLVHWRHHLPALSPDPDDGPNDGIFSGGAFAEPEQGRAVISYWKYSARSGFCIATSTDENLDHWTKHPDNPLIPERPGQRGIALVMGPDGAECLVSGADPTGIWKRDGRYYVATGNLIVLHEEGLKKNNPALQGDTLYLFESEDLAHWRYVGELYKSDRRWTAANEDCMCADFFPLPAGPAGGAPSGRHMLLFISHNRGCQYYIGDYQGNRFEPRQHGRMSWVDHRFGPPESLADHQGRRIMWAWLIDSRVGCLSDSPEEQAAKASGWSGVMSLPRVLWLGDDGTLRMRPADELKTLRYRPVRKQRLSLDDGREIVWKNIKGRSFEIEAEIALGATRRVELSVLCSPDGAERTVISYDADQQALQMDTRRSGPLQGAAVVESAPLALNDGEPLRLRVFVDGCIVEAFANDRQAMARHAYASPGSTEVRFSAAGGQADVTDLKAWHMMPSNPW